MQIKIAVVALGLTLLAATQAFAHCQVPCGIYDDHARVHAMEEDARTIAKAIDQIRELAGKTDAQSQNQLVRWTTTKEAHATNIQRTIADYFLTQRVKAPKEGDKAANDDYMKKLAAHHAVLVAAMKCKQKADPAVAKALMAAIEGIEAWYPEAK